MDQPPNFFVPDLPADEHEDAYARMAAHEHRAVPPLGQRVYSITFKREGVDWTATVGRGLKGVKGETKKVGGVQVWREKPIHDGSVVTAIFAGVPYLVFHSGGVRSGWHNPISVGGEGSIQFFRE